MSLTISIITPSYNSMPYIIDNIKSIKNQNHEILEHIIIDGDSDDGTIEFLKTQGDDISWISEKDRGQTDAINKAIKMAKGDIIGWLNSDDEYCENSVTKALKIFNENNNVGVVHGDLEIIDESGHKIGVSKSKQITSHQDLLLDNPIKQPGTFFRRKLFNKYGELDENLNYVMDREYWLRLLINKTEFVYLANTFLARFRLISGTKSFEENELFRLEWIDVIKKKSSVLNLPGNKFKTTINENLGYYYFQKSQRLVKQKPMYIKNMTLAFIHSKSLRKNVGFYKIFALGLIGKERNRYSKFKK